MRLVKINDKKLNNREKDVTIFLTRILRESFRMKKQTMKGP